MYDLNENGEANQTTSWMSKTWLALSGAVFRNPPEITITFNFGKLFELMVRDILLLPDYLALWY